jgi:hypothetical protein
MKSISVKAVLRVVGEGRWAEKAAQQAMPKTDITGVSNFMFRFTRFMN